MKKLLDILSSVEVSEIVGAGNPEIQRIVFDSREVQPGDLFVAVGGTQVDGHRFIPSAIRAGASAIIGEAFTDVSDTTIPMVKVLDSAKALGQAADQFYDHPSQQLKLIGVTGTNGKTTTVTLLHQLFSALGYKTGLISTIANKIGSVVIPATHTTPDAVRLHQLLSEMVEAGCDYVFMEVSSHAVHQERIAGAHYTGGVFTNLTHDHLDYHGTFRNYLEAKKKFFDNLPKTAFAITNVDDKNGRVMLQNTSAEVQTYGLRRMADFKAKIIENSLTGLHLDLNGQEFFARLIGGFNAYNLLAVYATAINLSQEPLEVLTVLSSLTGVPGRFQYLVDAQNGRIGIVDYAHIPDALEKVLQTITELRRGTEQIITVVGCGGDRDQAKRPLMAAVACKYSDQVLLTNDNPRTEDPELILQQMEAGIPAEKIKQVLTIADRHAAIKTATKLAQAKDIILVAGKGHEKYQEINGEKLPFDDLEELQRAFS